MDWKNIFIAILVIMLVLILLAFAVRHKFYSDYMRDLGRGSLRQYADVWDVQPADGGNYMRVTLMVAGVTGNPVYVNAMEWERYGPDPYERIAVWEVGCGIALQPMKNRNILAARTKL